MREALSEASPDYDEKEERVMAKPLRFVVAPHIVQDLGLNLYTSLPRALVEFVSNSYDADSPLASIEMDSIRGRASGEVQPAAAVPKGGAPPWLDRLPGSRGKVYAAGYSGPTFKPDAAVQYAGDNAVDNLAASLRAHVQAYTLLVQSTSGLSVDQFSQTEDPDEAFKDIVRKNAKVEATWVDRDGARPGDPPGAVWALASIDVQSTKGGVQSIQNQDLGPALDNQGNVTPDQPK